MMSTPVLVLASLLQLAPKTLDTSTSAQPGTTHFHAALAGAAQALPLGEGMDVFGVLSPRLEVRSGEVFDIAVGTDLRLRLWDQPPLEEGDFHGVLRREDWDELSDFGQLLQTLRIGQEDGRFTLHAGRVSGYSLGAGWLINRYDNRLSPDYHPASGNFTAYVGPARLEFFASDVLALRLFAAQARLDLGQLTSDKPENRERYYLALDVAHDFGRGGGTTPSMSAANLGVHVGLTRSERWRAWAQGALGARADTLAESIPDYGAALGVVVVGEPSSTVALSGRLEGRRQGGTFRFGLFGPGYELARFSGQGLSEMPLAREMLAPGFSGYGEMAVEVSPAGAKGLALEASASGEYFAATGRVDADVLLKMRLPGDKAEVSLRAILTGLMDAPRYQVVAGGLYRVLPSLYVLAQGGTVHFPEAEGRLRRGFTAGLGLGVDIHR
jgi:hypothetical protein